jgi:Protein of unknown function (DUF3631)
MTPSRVEPVPEIGQLLDELVVFLRRFVVMSDAQLAVVALWLVHTHALASADATPYLAVTSAEKRSGKSRLLEVLALLACKALLAANISEPALFRTIRDREPTILFDEVDAIFGPKAKNHEDLRGMLNSGFRRGTEVHRIVGEGSRMRAEGFPVFCPKVLAGIGELPDTIADRSLPIRLKRRSQGEAVERFRHRDVAAEAAELRDRMAMWSEGALTRLQEARPDLPDELDDRAQDAVEPLLAIADLAGGSWPERARASCVQLRGGIEADNRDSIGVRLLADLRQLFGSADRVSSESLCSQLNADPEAPWSDWRDGIGLTPRALAGLLRRYEIRSRTVSLGGNDTAKGYKREDFEDAWRRYLDPDPSGPSGPSNHAGLRAAADPSGPLPPDGSKQAAKPHEQTVLTDLTDRPRLGAAETEAVVALETAFGVREGRSRWVA